MKKIPVNIMVAVTTVSVLVLVIVLVWIFYKPAGDSGDIQALTKEIQDNNPKGMAKIPDDQKPSLRAVMAGGKGKR